MVTHALKRIVFAASLVASVSVAAQKASQPITLTDKDRAEIQQLSAGYAGSLGTCAAEDTPTSSKRPTASTKA